MILFCVPTIEKHLLFHFKNDKNAFKLTIQFVLPKFYFSFTFSKLLSEIVFFLLLIQSTAKRLKAYNAYDDWR
jgi:hypothetical protein